MPPSLQNEADLPVVDISEISHDSEEIHNHPVVATVREACKEWGFFFVVNHGVSAHLQQDLEEQIGQLCAMPAEVKEKAANSTLNVSYASAGDCDEGFNFLKMPQSTSVQEMCNKIWPDQGNPKLCETIGTYSLVLEDLARKIIRIIIASLGLDVKTFYHSDFEKRTANLYINNYFCNGKSLEEEILFPHTDIGFFTILYQDNKGGLQVQSKQGTWLNVKTLPHSFVVNVADILKVWSNGRYRSAEHRVVYKGWRNRISVPYFVQFPDEKQIWAPAELVDDDNPRRYRPFILSHFKQAYFNRVKSNKQNLSTFIETYAGGE